MGDGRRLGPESLPELESKLGELASVMLDSRRILISEGDSGTLAASADPLANSGTAAKAAPLAKSGPQPSPEPDSSHKPPPSPKPARPSKGSPSLKSIIGPKVHFGTDESGKGDYFGPLVVAGVYCDEEIAEAFLKVGVKDSKRLSDNQNLAKANRIKEILGPGRYNVHVLLPSDYNRLYNSLRNLNKILAGAHAKVIGALLDAVD